MRSERSCSHLRAVLRASSRRVVPGRAAHSTQICFKSQETALEQCGICTSSGYGAFFSIFCSSRHDSLLQLANGSFDARYSGSIRQLSCSARLGLAGLQLGSSVSVKDMQCTQDDLLIPKRRGNQDFWKICSVSGPEMALQAWPNQAYS